MACNKFFVVWLLLSTSTIGKCKPLSKLSRTFLQKSINLRYHIRRVEGNNSNLNSFVLVCGSNVQGSKTLDWEENGNCSCKPDFNGLKCDSCTEEYTKFPNHQGIPEVAALIVGGFDGFNELKTAEFIPQIGTSKKCSLPSLRTGIALQPSLIQTSDEILLCGEATWDDKPYPLCPLFKRLCSVRLSKSYASKVFKCLELKDNQWQEHSQLKNKRGWSSAVTMPGGVYIFGGWGKSKTTWEWLPSGTNQWRSGNSGIPGGFSSGCAVQINDKDILLIGGDGTRKRVLKFNTTAQEFTSLGDVLIQGRYHHACTRMEDKIVIAGGYGSGNYLKSTEIINIHDLTASHPAGNLVQKRGRHGLTVVYVDRKPTILAVGGSDGQHSFLDSIEMWNATTDTWTKTSMKLTEPKSSFGILALPTRSVCS